MRGGLHQALAPWLLQHRCARTTHRRLAARSGDLPPAGRRSRPARRARRRGARLLGGDRQRRGLALGRARAGRCSPLHLRAAARRRSRPRRSRRRRPAGFRLRLGATALRPGCVRAPAAGARRCSGCGASSRPSEYIIGGKDPGRLHERRDPDRAAGSARRSAIRSSPSVPPFARDLFFPSLPARTTTTACGSWGSSIRNPDTGAVVGQFPHLFPASIAIGYGLDGLTGARRTVGVWAILGLLAVYFAGARLVGRAGGVGGGGTPGAARHAGLVRAVSERRDGDAGAALRGAAGERPRARRRRSLLRAGRRRAARPAAVPAVRRGAGHRRACWRRWRSACWRSRRACAPRSSSLLR